MTVRSSLRAGTLAALAATGADAILRRRNRSRLLVVCYHGVHDGKRAGESWLVLHAREFERQVAHLASNYALLTIDEGLARLRAGTLDVPTACITFDDGYLNNLTHALPVLERYRAPATIYLATGLIGTDRRLWTTQVALALEAHAPGTVRLEGIGSGEHRLAGRADAYALAHQICTRWKELPPADRNERLDELFAICGRPVVDDDGVFGMMDWAQVRSMARGLVTFGAHTVNHEIVSNLDDALLAFEIGESVRRVGEELRDHADAISRTFAYPNGGVADFDQRATVQLRAAGCVGAVSTLEGLNDADADPYALRRVVVGGRMGLADFQARTAGFMEMMLRMRGT